MVSLTPQISMIAMTAPAGARSGNATCAPITPSRSGTLMFSVLTRTVRAMSQRHALQARGLDDLAPLFHFLAYQAAKLLRRGTYAFDTHFRELLLDRGGAQCPGQLALEFGDDGLRRAARCKDSVPSGGIEFEAALGDRRQLRHQRGALFPAHGQSAQPARFHLRYRRRQSIE